MKKRYVCFGILLLAIIGIIFISGYVKQHAPESTTPETTPQQTEPETPKQREFGFWQKLDSVEILPSKTLNVERYGSEACFLGSLAMLFNYDNPTITYEKMLEQAQITHEPGSGKVNDYFRKDGAETTPTDILDIISDLGYKPYIGYSKPERPFKHFWLSKVPSQQLKEFSNEQEAEDYLKKAISSGFLPMVTVEYNVIIKYLEPEHPDVPLLDHYMVVVGYDENYFYLNDPIPETEDPPSIVENQKIPKDKFLQAWRDTAKLQISFQAIYGMIIIQKKV